MNCSDNETVANQSDGVLTFSSARAGVITNRYLPNNFQAFTVSGVREEMLYQRAEEVPADRP